MTKKLKCCLRTCNEEATNRVGIGGLFHYACFEHAMTEFPSTYRGNGN